VLTTRLGTHRYSGDDSQSGCSTQANTYSDRTRSQGASSDPGEGSLARRLKVLSVGDSEFAYRIRSMNEPHKRVARESELQGV
jgi:hypothetical protein